MEKLQFDSGIRTFRVNGGESLRFNPADPNLYTRLQAASDKLPEIQKSLSGTDVPKMLTETDGQLKRLLSEVFPGNDMEKIFAGVNLLAPTATGKTVFENFICALEPILQQGAQCCAQSLIKGSRDE
ncbi:MAG: hypothetical protein IJD63_01445 [Oscillospiraceae bacterium]|nr:hypothetical protein [Oscillospiraceae bacterium]